MREMKSRRREMDVGEGGISGNVKGKEVEGRE